jgi:hypothetical protein
VFVSCFGVLATQPALACRIGLLVLPLLFFFSPCHYDTSAPLPRAFARFDPSILAFGDESRKFGALRDFQDSMLEKQRLTIVLQLQTPTIDTYIHTWMKTGGQRMARARGRHR